MTLIFTSTQTPVGVFTLLIKCEDEHDTVIAAGFSDYRTLQQRLPLDFQNQACTEVPDHSYGTAIRNYFSGNLDALTSIRYDQPGTTFSHAVWKAMRTIPAGTTQSYKALATASLHEKASRAAGSACAHNLVTLLIPCHRVVRSDGKVGHYYYGPHVKQFLIDHEAKHSHATST